MQHNMEDQLIHITNITHEKTITPKSGSGTGYSQPDIFGVEFTYNGEKHKTTILIDIWYRTVDTIPTEFIRGLERKLFIDKVANIKGAFCMYAWEAALFGMCPYTYEELLTAFENYQKINSK